MRILIDNSCDGKESFQSYTEKVTYQRTANPKWWYEILAPRYVGLPEYENVHVVEETMENGFVVVVYEYKREETHYFVDCETIEDVVKILLEHEWWSFGRINYKDKSAIGFFTEEE